VQVEDSFRRLGAPVPHDVEEDAAEDAARLERLLEAGVDRLEARARVEADAREDLRRDVDLRVAQPSVRERLRHRDRRGHVVVGRAEEPAELRVELEETARVLHRRARPLELRGIGEPVPRARRRRRISDCGNDPSK
jgi:hypothetical protein